MRQDDLIRVSDVVHEIPVSFHPGMRVPARIYADDDLLEAMVAGEAVSQLVNVASLPGVTGHVYGMPDMHEGYGFPVGGVAATELPDGVISPGGVGFDINCGVRLIATPLSRRDVGDKLEMFVHEISRSIPSGVGRGGRLQLSDGELDRVLAEGSGFLVSDKGFGTDADLVHTESSGCMPGAQPDKVSARARDRGRGQLGTMGAGNHFVEVQEVEHLFDPVAATALGLREGQVTVLIHTGSRGLGHQVCTDYVKLMDSRLAGYGITLPDRQLSCAPVSSPEGRDYLGAMAAAANFAWANRQLIGHQVRQTVVRIFPRVSAEEVRVVYDVAHNIAKVEEHDDKRVCVHRKGATRAFGPSSSDLPADCRGVGQPVFIPGSMGTASLVLVGMDSSETLSWGSACHGAGRALSRRAAKKRIAGVELRKELEERGIVVRCPSSAGLAEEAPIAYKDVDRVGEVVERAGLARRVARLRPIGVIKGG